jgi:hypothetical protein
MASQAAQTCLSSRRRRARQARIRSAPTLAALSVSNAMMKSAMLRLREMGERFVSLICNPKKALPEGLSSAFHGLGRGSARRVSNWERSLRDFDCLLALTTLANPALIAANPTPPLAFRFLRLPTDPKSLKSRALTRKEPRAVASRGLKFSDMPPRGVPYQRGSLG